MWGDKKNRLKNTLTTDRGEDVRDTLLMPMTNDTHINKHTSPTHTQDHTTIHTHTHTAHTLVCTDEHMDAQIYW